MSREFIWGETPTIFVGRVDHFIYASLWFEGVSADPTRDAFELIGLAPQYRTERLKKYRAWDTIYRGGYIDTNIRSILGHMSNEANSRVTILDGYPEVYHKLIINRFNHIYNGIYGEEMGVPFTNRISHEYCKTKEGFKNSITKYEAEAIDREWAFIDLGDPGFVNCIPELDHYNSALKYYSEHGHREGVDSSALTKEELDALLKGDVGEGNVQ